MTSGSGLRPMKTVIAASKVIGATTAKFSLEEGVPALGGSFQKASIQILVIEKTVRRPTNKATPPSQPAPWRNDASITMNLAQNPESGGMPASESAGIKKRTASHGELFINPPA